MVNPTTVFVSVTMTNSSSASWKVWTIVAHKMYLLELQTNP